MTAFALLFPLAITTLIAVLLYGMPSLMPATLPLGVSVPRARSGDPAVTRHVRAYRMAIIASWILSLALLLGLSPTVPAAAVLTSVLFLVAASTVAYVVARSGIVRAKRRGDWYADATVRPPANVASVQQPPAPVGWLVFSLVVLLVAFGIGVAVYPSLPQSVPVHWGASGQPDRFAPKGVWSVFGPLIIGVLVAAGLFAVSFAVRAAPVRADQSLTAEQNERRASLIQSAGSSLIGRLTAATAIMIVWPAVVSWLWPDASGAVIAGIVVGVALMLIVVVAFVLASRRAAATARVAVDGDMLGASARSRRPGAGSVSAAHDSGPAHASTPDAPDDDRYWKGGLIYVNRDDPAVFVQRRFGVGWTVNFGRPGGVLFGVVLVVLVVAAIVSALVAGH
ncbi:DUF1648 domain-containing protein [Humibacter ginsenosidimutans]|uniref:DUF1648 domain-containing protein n=1 Tax=Humibacter ginsenosidimutans TaxID=2599293 RepID=A0A5B8M3Z0_9MICO|nr:DUF1648 domain-containing protein [Humibacter ginsenosidimutans]QDZ14442.1 DUF1648 domain-containing protein [Humibacter ginsenosidimutans]